MFSPVHCVWLLVSLCVCGTSNFERFFFVGTIVLRYVLRYVLFISLVFFWCDSCEMRKRNVVQRVA